MGKGQKEKRGKVLSFSFFLLFGLSYFFSSLLEMQLDPIYNPFSHLFELKSQIVVLSRLNVHGSQRLSSHFRSYWVTGLQEGKLRHAFGLSHREEREKTDPNQKPLTSLSFGERLFCSEHVLPT